jgi:hypothetical protein
MNIFKKPGLIIAILALVGLGSYIIRELFPKNVETTVIQDHIVTLHDTIKIESVVFQHLPAHIESVFVKETTWVASVDSILPPYGDTLGVWYYFPPVNAFDFSFRPSPRPVEFQYLYKDTMIYVQQENSNIWGDIATHTASFLAGYGLAKLVK